MSLAMVITSAFTVVGPVARIEQQCADHLPFGADAGRRRVD
jgi:hypothetical protein